MWKRRGNGAETASQQEGSPAKSCCGGSTHQSKHMPSQTDTELVDSCIEFLEDYYSSEIGKLVQSFPQEQTSLTVSYRDVLLYDVGLADDLVENPDMIRRHIEDALARYDVPLDVDLSSAAVRFTGVPGQRSHYVDELRSHTMGGLVGVEGQVSNRTAVRPAPTVATFECERCGTRADVPQDPFASELQDPHECSGCERQGPFSLDMEQSSLRDIQIARVQLPPERSAGEASQHVDILLEGDATGQVSGGDRVRVTGVHDWDDDNSVGLAHRIRGDSVDVKETTFSGVEIEPHLEDIRALASGEHGDPFDLLVDSLAPSIVGMEQIKRALALQLFGGVRAKSPDGTTTRGDIHVLLIGDPGTAKSTFLEDIESKSPNAVMVSGKGATAAGLTAAASQIEFGGSSEWALDPGAMVLADDGVACIDEIDKVDEGAVESLHQALSKQRVSVNKAGINATLPTRTAVLAAGNPKYGRYDQYEPIAEQIDMSPTLLSRFDLIWPVADDPDPEEDIDIAQGMMQNHDEAIRYSRGDIGAEETSIDPAIDTELLRAWVAHSKESCHPRWPENAARHELVESFVSLRSEATGDDAPIPVTYRAIESQRRLAEASARLRLSDTVEPQDVKRASELYMAAMEQVGIDPESGDLDADVIETGQSRSQRERVRKLHNIIRELSAEYDKGAPLDVVYDRAEQVGIQRTRAEIDIQKLKDKGEIYSPAEDTLKPT